MSINIFNLHTSKVVYTVDYPLQVFFSFSFSFSFNLTPKCCFDALSNNKKKKEVQRYFSRSENKPAEKKERTKPTLLRKEIKTHT